jgi:hypothetical protein
LNKKTNQRTERVQKINYTPLGPPHPAKLVVHSVDEYTCKLQWTTKPYPKLDFVTGYRLIINSKLDKLLNKNVNEFTFTDMKQGRTYDIQIVTLINSVVGQSDPSNTIVLVCPGKPATPRIVDLPTTRPNSIAIGWKACFTTQSDEAILYRVYVNDKLNCEIYSENKSSYTHIIKDLQPGTPYLIHVIALNGDRTKFPSVGPRVCCLVKSEKSNRLQIVPTSQPKAIRLKLAAMHSEGIDVTWQYPHQQGSASVSGYQIIRNGALYGDVIGNETYAARITDVEIGDTVDLQIIALTNHPVSKFVELNDFPDYEIDPNEKNYDPAQSTSGKSNNKHNRTVLHPDFPSCRPGPILTVNYTGLVRRANKIWTEKVTGYTALVIFEINRKESYHIDPDYYSIEYWPEYTSENKQTTKTDKDYIELSNLTPGTVYNVQVESRKEKKRSELSNNETLKDERFEYTYLLYSKSSIMQFQTASPPDAPTNITVVSTTCHAIKICWDPPVCHGSELVATRISCYPINVDKPLHIFKELTPDCTTCVVDNLSEKTPYRITVTAVTEEYLSSHKIKDMKQIPRVVLDEIPWLPSSYIGKQYEII